MLTVYREKTKVTKEAGNCPLKNKCVNGTCAVGVG